MQRLHNIYKTLIFRLTIFMAVGIFVSDWLIRDHNLIRYHIIAIAVLLIILFFSAYQKYSVPHHIFGVTVMFSMFLFGSLLTQLKWKENRYEWGDKQQFQKATILNISSAHNNTTKLNVKTDNGIVFITIINDSFSKNLKRGEGIIFYSTIEKPQKRGNPYEFDYANYLYHHDVNGISIIYPGYWKVVKREKVFSIKEMALKVRDKIFEIYKSWDLDNQTLAIVSALSIGEKRCLSDELKESYSNAGISHVLSLSGMHTAIVWGILSLLLSFMNGNIFFKIIKWLILSFLLWGFAFITGLSPTIVRAVIMCTLTSLFSISTEHRNPLTILFFAAFCMLCYNPFYLFDIAFQLSFLSVLSIMAFSRKIAHLFSFKSIIIKHLWEIVSVSLAAQMGTLPLVVYYFHSVPLYSIISNIVAALLTPLILASVIIYFLFLLLNIPKIVIIYIIKNMVLLLNNVTLYIGTLPFSTFKYYNIYIIDLLIAFALLLFLFVNLEIKRRNNKIVFLFLFSCLLSVKAVETYNESNKDSRAIIYNTYDNAGIHFVEKDGKSFYVVRGKDSISKSVNALLTNFCNHENKKKPKLINKCKNKYINSTNGLIEWHKKTFLILNDRSWNNKTGKIKKNVDYLYLNKRYYSTISHLGKLFNVRNIIFDSSIENDRLNRFKDECKKMKINYYSIKEKGCWKVSL